MKITLTKQETTDLIKQALVDNHVELLDKAGMGYMDATKFDIKISTYEEEDYLEVTKKPEPVKEEEK